MTYEEHLRILNSGHGTTLEEIKTEYRRLAKTCHPDMGGDASKFQELTASYDWLLANHVPTRAPRDLTGYQKYFRIFEAGNSFATTVPYDGVLTENVAICGICGSMEFRILLSKGEKLPKEILLLNLGGPAIHMIIRGEHPS